MRLKSLKMKNILSFGGESSEIMLGPLNVIVGPNGSGKSNLLEIISLLQAAPTSLTRPMRRKGGGGVRDWLWKRGKGSEDCTAEVEAVIDRTEEEKRKPDHSDWKYNLQFTMSDQRFHLLDERLENEKAYGDCDDVYFYYRYQNNRPVLNSRKEQNRRLESKHVDPELSILSQIKDPIEYPEVTNVGEYYSSIKIFREWEFGRNSELRKPQDADAPNEYLDEDCLNLGLVLNSLRREPEVKRKILSYLGEFYEGVTDYEVSIEGGSVQLFLEEKDIVIPATRLSDGTIRFICLLAILCHPKPPALICIEEPELGLHPDIIPSIAKLLIDASDRTQIIITTHSDVLVDSLSEYPESLVVCEKGEQGTTLSRLDSGSISEWLEEYSLGRLWRMGEIGGNRW